MNWYNGLKYEKNKNSTVQLLVVHSLKMYTNNIFIKDFIEF